MRKEISIVNSLENAKKLGKEAYDFYIKSYADKVKYLEANGIDFSRMYFFYNPKREMIDTGFRNPITGRKIVFDRIRFNKKKMLAVQGKLILKHNISNFDEMFAININIEDSYEISKAEQQELTNRYKQIDDLNTREKRWGIEEKIIEEIETMEKHEKIYFDDFVALHDYSFCINKNHKLEKINALIFVLREDGTIMHKFIPAWYCYDCKKYFITKWQYEEICYYGVPLCQLIRERSDINSYQYESYYDELPAESVLFRSGYNVSAHNNLSSEQRCSILILLLESGLCSRHKINSHLTWLIESRRGNRKMKNAVEKWTEDRKYIMGYKFDNAKIVGIKLVRNVKSDYMK